MGLNSTAASNTFPQDPNYYYEDPQTRDGLIAQHKGLGAVEFTEHLLSTFCLQSPCLVQVTEHILSFWMLVARHVTEHLWSTFCVLDPCKVYFTEDLSAPPPCWIHAIQFRASIKHLRYAGFTLKTRDDTLG